MPAAGNSCSTRVDICMEDVEVGKGKIQEIVAALATGQGIDPAYLVFKWESKPLVLQEFGIELADKILQLGVCLGKKSKNLSFSELAVRTGATNPREFLSAYNDYIVDGLKRLESASSAQISRESRSSRK
jgi:hypothetical protein